MMEVLSERVMTSATADALLSRVTNDMREGHSLFLLHPRAMSVVSLTNAVLERFQRQNLRFERLRASDLEARRLPSSLLEHYGVSRSLNGRDPLAELLTSLNGCDIVLLEELNTLSASHQRYWMDLAVMWGREIARRASEGRTACSLCCITSLAPELLGVVLADVKLKFLWWWGIPSALEIRLSCRSIEDGTGKSPETEWREHVASSLASGNSEYLHCLWPWLTASSEELLRASRDFARQRGWTLDALKIHALDDSPGDFQLSQFDILEPPERLRVVWNEGLVGMSHEYGCEVHSAVLAVLEKREAFVARLWRGQTALILPRLDDLRYRLCDHLTRTYGRSWSTRWCVPESAAERAEVERSPFACQWGYLCHLLHTAPGLRRESRFRPLATVARSLRNALTHCRTVEFDKFTELCVEAERAFSTSPPR